MKLITRETLAKRLQCSERTLYRLFLEGELLQCSATPPMYDCDDVRDFLNERKRGMAADVTSDIPVDFFTTVGASKSLGINADVLRRWVRHHAENGIPHYRISTALALFRMESLSAWFKQRKASAHKDRLARARKASEARTYYRKLKDRNDNGGKQ